MRHPFQGSQSGTSLIELLMGSAMLAVVGLGASFFFKSVSTGDAEARARADAVSEITLFQSAIERDFKLREISTVPPPVCPTNAVCGSFNVVRYVKGDVSSPGEKKMRVDFTTVCVPAPSLVDEKFARNEIFSFSRQDIRDRSSNNKGAFGNCFEEIINCPPRQYPQIVIDPRPIAGAILPSYPRFAGGVARFPVLSNSQGITKGVIGAAICGKGSASDTADRIYIDAAYVNAEGQIRVEKREVILPRGNVANIQILPTH